MNALGLVMIAAGVLMPLVHRNRLARFRCPAHFCREARAACIAGSSPRETTASHTWCAYCCSSQLDFSLCQMQYWFTTSRGSQQWIKAAGRLAWWVSLPCIECACVQQGLATTFPQILLRFILIPGKYGDSSGGEWGTMAYPVIPVTPILCIYCIFAWHMCVSYLLRRM